MANYTVHVITISVEKILRVQPDIKKLYLLLRASNPYLATHRLQNEVIGKDIFRVLRDKWGADFGSFISKKVVAVAGDVSLNNLGIKDENMRSQMFEELNVIVHTAATTNFNERYDIAIGTNTMGAFHVVNFAKSCHKLGIVLHVSTAYVCGEAEGLIVEEPLHVNGMQKGSTKLDIELEKQLIEEKLKEFKAHNTDKEVITSVMKSFGLARANLHGWPNTYVFTKAMGEILLMKMKDTLPLFVIRPTTVVSTHSEPFPGWIEGVRTIDFVVVNYGQGILTSFVGNSETILDLIPVDMVVNFMIVALMALSKGLSKNLVYHIGSSLRNPIKLTDVVDAMYYYFKKNPCVDKYGKLMAVTKKLTITGANEFNQNKGSKLVKKTEDLYKTYSLFKGIFDVKNAESLRIVTKGLLMWMVNLTLIQRTLIGKTT
ncbi:putative fatty acyl-CoA reductase 5 [Glycine max]|nr:putative fatty acyl-CoA reductase 5 [Glycine max]